MAEVWKPGLSLVPKTMFAPHWDMVENWIPGATDFILGSVPEGHTFIGLDEDTAMVGTGDTWEVMGRSGIHIRQDGRDLIEKYAELAPNGPHIDEVRRWLAQIPAPPKAQLPRK